ncbi:MAG: c-type cytochrome domain-containing protein, partial [Planctomycetaceae bacterium]
MTRSSASVPLFLFVLLLPCWILSPTAAADPQYNRDVRPILLDACFSCHGPDSASRKADLRLDQFDAAVAAGAIVPGDPQSSEIIRRIQSTDPDIVMPPPEFKKPLTDGQKRVLADWIGAGGKYQQHWSYLPPEPGEPPQIPAAAAVSYPEWSANP